MSSLRCPQCGATIRPARLGRPPIFCGPRCRDRAYRGRGRSAPFAVFSGDAAAVAGLKGLPVDAMHDIADTLREGQ